jgi:catalase
MLLDQGANALVHTFDAYDVQGRMWFGRPEDADACEAPKEEVPFTEPQPTANDNPDPLRQCHGSDDYVQPGNLFRLFTRDQQERLFKNIAAAMEGATEEIIQRQLLHFHRADPQYAEGVARALKVTDTARNPITPRKRP